MSWRGLEQLDEMLVSEIEFSCLVGVLLSDAEFVATQMTIDPFSTLNKQICVCVIPRTIKNFATKKQLSL